MKVYVTMKSKDWHTFVDEYDKLKVNLQVADEMLAWVQRIMNDSSYTDDQRAMLAALREVFADDVIL